jgi:hypothetical protein
MGWCLPIVQQRYLSSQRPIIVDAAPSFNFVSHVGAQLPFGIIISTLDQFTCRKIKKTSGERENNSPDRNNFLGSYGRSPSFSKRARRSGRPLAKISSFKIMLSSLRT